MRALVATALLLGACGGGGGSAPDLVGMYSIDSHTESQAGATPATCSGPGEVIPPEFLQLSIDDFGGLDSLAWALCETEQPSSCDPTDFFTFDDIDGEWTIGAATSAAFSGGGCTLFHAEGDVTQQSEEPVAIRLELKEWNEFESLSEEQCTIEAADALAEQDDCERHVIITATRL
jgi:hypothetical protein